MLYKIEQLGSKNKYTSNQVNKSGAWWIFLFR